VSTAYHIRSRSKAMSQAINQKANKIRPLTKQDKG